MPQTAPQLAAVFEKLAARDAEGFLRAAVHALVDPAVDSLIDGIRGRGVVPVASVPFAGGPAADLGLPPGSAPIPPSPPMAATETPRNSDADVSALRARVETLEAEVRAYQDTIVSLHRQAEASQAQELAATPIKRRRGKRQARARAVPAPGNGKTALAAPHETDLIDVKTITQRYHISSSSIRIKCRKREFPSPVAKRRLADLWCRADVEQWARLTGQPQASVETKIEQREQEAAAALDAAIDHEDATSEDLNLLDAKTIGQMIPCTTAMFHYHCSKSHFPKPAGRRGKGYVYRPTDVEAWIAARKVEARGQPAQTQPHKPYAPGAPCCLNCHYSRGVQNTGERRCRKAGGQYEGKLRSPRDSCSGHKLWRAHLRQDEEAEEPKADA